MRDKAVDEIAGLLFPYAHEVILTEPQQPRAISAAVLSQMTAHLTLRLCVIRDPAEALEHAIEAAGDEGDVFVAGSLYLVGEVRAFWRSRKLAVTRRGS
jgi:dihydrofolate synthase/folylpolyglutamate synthase